MIASEKEIVAALRIRYAAPEWALVTQVCETTGYSNRRCDAVAMILRRATEMLSEPVDLTPVLERKLEKAIEREKNLILGGKELSKLREQLQRFEKASGIKIDTWQDGAELGTIVRELLSGGSNLEWLISPLRGALKQMEDAKSKWEQIRNGQNRQKKR